MQHTLFLVTQTDYCQFEFDRTVNIAALPTLEQAKSRIELRIKEMASSALFDYVDYRFDILPVEYGTGNILPSVYTKSPTAAQWKHARKDAVDLMAETAVNDDVTPSQIGGAKGVRARLK
ncbi:MAG: hypothetical protein GJ680_07630 [Alteromonadaceae bacterium]|nr:hypothetical protein [Alteromonadaceae bacterium]